MKVAVIQYSPSDNKAENLEFIESTVRAVAADGARLAVLPEYSIFTLPSLDERFIENAERIDGPAVSLLMRLSGELGIALIAGINEVATDTRIYNTLVGIDGGVVKETYRKVHLYDAFGHKESDWIIPGEPNSGRVYDVDGFRVGLQTCYDLRFPEASRVLMDGGADVIAMPAQWVPGPLKELHWDTLIRARAIENTCYVLAADQAGPNGAGHSAIIDPMGIALAQLGDTSGTGFATISRERLDEVRKTNPSLSLRRYDVRAKS